ncbi:unnamed protein product [Dicrocoelium dendriticum]|nr:unnamed protein product [Dicrocoelium dendriticum]
MNGTGGKVSFDHPPPGLSVEASLTVTHADRNVNTNALTVAQYLIEEKFYLTALEFHFEQLDRGTCLPQLNGFFSNASFFENMCGLKCEGPPTVARCSSVSTLDSMDIGRISDDGNSVEEKLKVLEYELRKKNSEIQSLRSELTNLTVGCTFGRNVPSNASQDVRNSTRAHQQNMHPHELRALCVLINDFLLQHNYRITAVQFVEESESAGLQDVGSWDQVGVNLDKPPDLLHLLRSYWSMSSENSEALDRDQLAIPRGTESKSRNILVHASHESTSISYNMQAVLDEVFTLKSSVSQWESKYKELAAQAQCWRNQLVSSRRENEKHSRLSKSPSAPQEPSTSLASSPVPSSDSSEVESVQSAVMSAAKSSTKCLAVHPSDERLSSPGFRKHITDMLPHCEFSLNSDNNAFHLATSLDEFVVLVSSRLESILPSMADEGKIANLPLLTQAICLHPDSGVRDRLTQLLLNLFSNPTQPTSNHVHGISTNDASFSRHYSGSHHHRLLILNACCHLASYLGPTRLESELIPQLWSHLNEHPPPSTAQRSLLVSACGVIAPQTPAHLQSSLLLSILESNLDDERDELVRAASIRSLACLVGIMSDQNKLPRLVQRLNSLLALDQASSTSESHTSTGKSSESIGLTLVSSKPTFVNTVEWLLPALAQWCLELNCLHTTLINPWLDHLDSYLSAARSTDSSTAVPYDAVIHTLGVLDYLVPFLHTWVMISLFKPEAGQTYWTTAMKWVTSNRECSFSTNAVHLSPPPLSEANEPLDTLVNVRLLLGPDVYRSIQSMFLVALDQSTDRDATEDPFPTSQTMHSDRITIDNWTARSWLDNILLSKLADLLVSTPRQVTKSPNAGSVYSHGEMLETFATHQFDEHFASPWSSFPKTEHLGVCLSVCQFLSTFGHSVGPVGVQKLLGLPLQNALMNKTKLGNFEYNHQTIQTGLLAGYCCLLASVRVKSESNRARVLLTNAIFLQVRESYELDSIRLAIWCLCRISDIDHAVSEIILPAIRTCVSCADCMVRRAAATLLHTLIEALHLFQVSGNDKSVLGQSVLDLLLQLVSQLARDDVTGQRRLLNPDEADWSVIAVSLGPLYSLWRLCRAQPGHTIPGAVNTDVLASSSDVNASGPKDGTEVDEQLYKLIGLQFNLVVGMSDPAKLSLHMSGAINEVRPDQLLVTQQRFWSVLTSALLVLTDRILPSCSSRFRDTVILPWLCHLAELNNALPDLDHRARLADRLFAVFSTAAYSTHVEESLLHWLVPGLDRVRLDLVEAGDHVRTHEVEQFLNDIYSRIQGDDKYHNSSKRREPGGGLRNAVTTQLAKLTSRGNTTNTVCTSTSSRGLAPDAYLRTKTSKLGLKKRPIQRQDGGPTRK